MGKFVKKENSTTKVDFGGKPTLAFKLGKTINKANSQKESFKSEPNNFPNFQQDFNPQFNLTNVRESS